MENLNILRKSLVSATEFILWYGFLLVLVGVSFIHDLYSSSLWMSVTAAVYFLCGLCVFNVVMGARINQRGLVSAGFVILLLCGTLLLLITQIYLPVDRHTESLLIKGSLYTGGKPDWLALPGVWSVVPEKTRWLFLSELLIVSVFALSIALVNNRRRLKQLVSVLLLVGLIHSVTGIAAKYLGVSLVDTQQLDGHFTQARGMFVNKNHFAGFLNLCLLGGFTFLIKTLFSQPHMRISSVLVHQIISFRILYPVCIVIGLTAIVLSQSRAGAVALPLSVLIVYLAINIKRSKTAVNQKLKTRNLILLFVSLVLSLSFVMFFYGAEILVLLRSTAILGERIDQWILTMRAINQAWLFGFGGNSYADVFQIYRGYDDFRQVVFNQSHNDYLHIWLEQGIVGLSLWLGFITLTFQAALRSINKNKSTLAKATLISVLIVVLAAVTQSFVDFNLQILNIRFYFFVIMSLAFSVPVMAQHKGA
jgi:O-antigen ligase